MAKKVVLSLSGLKSRSLKCAKAFKDYNFRTYFVSKVEKDFAALEAKKLSGDELAVAIKKKHFELKQLQRMAMTNVLYGNRKVFLDPSVDQK